MSGGNGREGKGDKQKKEAKRKIRQGDKEKDGED